MAATTTATTIRLPGRFSLTVPSFPSARAESIGGPARLLAGLPGVVGLHHPLHQRMADHVALREGAEADALHVGQDLARMDEAGLAALWQVDLRHVARDHRLGAEAEAGEKHLHLLGRGVLRLVEDDEGVVERPAAHEGERRHFDGSLLDERARDRKSTRLNSSHVKIS